MDTAWWAAHKIAETLAIPFQVPVRPLLCVHGTTLPRGGLFAGDLPMVGPKDLPGLLASLPEVLDPAQVAVVAQTARACLQPAG